MSQLKKYIIAIDGHSSCGKSTVAKALAKKLDYTYIDTGAMYRAATLAYLRLHPEIEQIDDEAIDTHELDKLLDELVITFKHNPLFDKQETYLNGENVEDEIRTLRVSNNVSNFSKLRIVRDLMVSLQQKMGENGGIVMDGRDIGTIVFPNADLKIFMTASADIRAMRRFKELSEKGENVSFEEIKENVEKRDFIDSNREVNPLRKADDAIMLDNSNMNREEQLEWILKVAKLQP